MSCIKEDLIQKYIDRETSREENERIRTHLESCSECAKAVEEQKKLATSIKELIKASDGPVEVPEFKEEGTLKTTKTINFKRWIAYGSAAACIIAAILIFYPKQEKNIELIFSYNIESEYNANSPLSEQEMVLEIIDSKGNLVTF